MGNKTKVSRRGNGLAVARQAGVHGGDCVKLVLDRERGIVVRPARRKYELSDLVARITPKNRHAETDW